MKTTYGQRVYRHRTTPGGLYIESFRISEMTGRELDLVTVVPEHVWKKHKSPYYNSYQVPAKELIDEQALHKLLATEQLHPAMTVSLTNTTEP